MTHIAKKVGFVCVTLLVLVPASPGLVAAAQEKRTDSTPSRPATPPQPKPPEPGPSATSGDDATASSPAGEALPEFAPDEFILLPIRVHLLRSEQIPEIDACNLTETDIDRILGKVNGVWRQAGVRWVLQSIVCEPAADEERFALSKSLGSQALGQYLTLRPELTRDPALHHVYFIHEFQVNGVYLGNNIAFVKETARLRPVEGGIDEPIPRVLSHELGHSLGLPHRQHGTNLMASGTTGTLFNAAEIQRSREVAMRASSAATAEQLARRARVHFDAGRWCDALAIDAELIALPGESKLKRESVVRYFAALRFGVGSDLKPQPSSGR